MILFFFLYKLKFKYGKKKQYHPVFKKNKYKYIILINLDIFNTLIDNYYFLKKK